MQATSRENGDITAINGDSPALTFPPDSNGYVTLTATDIYYFIVGGLAGASLTSVEIRTDSAIAGTFTVETCNFPRDVQNGPSLVTDNDEGGSWVKNDPTGAYVPSNGTGWTWTLLTGVKTAGVGSAILDLGNIGARRARIAFNCTTGGKVRVNANTKVP